MNRIVFNSALMSSSKCSARPAQFLAAFWVLVTLMFSGCATHKIEINQGNYVTQDQVNRLKEGMTRSQVRALLGAPLTESIFHTNRWDYQFTLERGGVRRTGSNLTVFFDTDKVARWDARDAAPDPILDPNRASALPDSNKTWWQRTFGK